MYRDEREGGFDSWHERDLRPLRKRIALTILSQYNFGRVLEIGCGKGTLTHRVKRKNNHVVGTDISPTAIARARASYPDIDFRVMTAQAASEMEERFDLVAVMGVFAYVQNWKYCLSRFPTLAPRCLLAEFVPPNPIGCVKSIDELSTEFCSLFTDTTKIVIDDNFCLLFGKAKG
ncbi:MAG TPA: class I SAM-dependent methyltransferase [Rhizomicrobium sp.]|jgi:2-polyprenyl-3-methyl-5-hydroxy-6-metoxy-1,4-benzoquinol methylase|nr:class I SAM-dependent methyltransferase [Rhizomicrobium sp.]